MEDFQKNKKIILTIICTIIIIVIAVISLNIYKIYKQKESTNNFYTYLKENNYKKNDDGIYTKKTKQKNQTITNRAISDKYLFEKDISEDNDDKYISISLFYTNDKTIEIMYQIEGFDQNDQYGVLFQKGTYQNGDFKCEIVTNQNFKTECNYMKKMAKEYEKEINQIIKNNNINPKYINIEKDGRNN